MTESHTKISKSSRLRKYACAYNSYLRKLEKTKIERSSRRVRNNNLDGKSKIKERNNTEISNKRKPLNKYQKFVQTESQKREYGGLDAKKRISKIANEWKKKH